MTLTHRNILDLVVLFVFAEILPLAAILLRRYGLRRSAGWIYMLVLAALRITGSITGLTSTSASDPRSLLEASIICYSIGLTPILLLTLSFLRNANNNAPKPILSSILLRLPDVPIIVALALAILGSTKVMGTDTKELNTGVDFLKYASIIFAATLAVIGLFILLIARARASLPAADRKLITIMFFTWPLMAVKVLYGILSAFERDSKAFSSTSNDIVSIVVQVAMSLLPEALIAYMYVVTGFFAAKEERVYAYHG
ncbi:uncharacterized protein AB675_7344 [Cyphellophora attinorum]|uniref:DUF7702 domain-containing protein n=1 Tax=Cyphellophora attinorum TaxID=1664694 RepID=A0A0N1H3L5_9EURO|nr:uncharacterized protein AB675_7344 [Phialophora attinorum]KPI36282.1 hypothetical protein AB675_7344 [Phialophora attinorum]